MSVCRQTSHKCCVPKSIGFGVGMLYICVKKFYLLTNNSKCMRYRWNHGCALIPKYIHVYESNLIKVNSADKWLTISTRISNAHSIFVSFAISCRMLRTEFLCLPKCVFFFLWNLDENICCNTTFLLGFAQTKTNERRKFRNRFGRVYIWVHSNEMCAYCTIYSTLKKKINKFRRQNKLFTLTNHVVRIHIRVVNCTHSSSRIDDTMFDYVTVQDKQNRLKEANQRPHEKKKPL